MTSNKMADTSVETIAKKNLCLSCGACSVICDQEAISYVETVGGLVLPKINEVKCVECGLCVEVCPGINCSESIESKTPEDPFIGKVIECRVGKANDEMYYSNSQSGGIVSSILDYLISNGEYSGAIVTAMNHNAPPRPYSYIAFNKNQLLQAQKSKYSPVPVLATIKELKDVEAPVALVGLPCHIHGINNLIDKCTSLEDKIGLKIGLICDRVMSAAAIDYIGHKATRKPIKHLIFRDKQSPRYPGNPVVTSIDGDNYTLKASLRMSIKDFFTPSRCRLCFDKMNIYADILCGDPHGIGGVDRVGGEGLIITRTERGENIICIMEKQGLIDCRSTNLNQAALGQKIDKKRQDWSNHVRIWAAASGDLPEYPDNVYKACTTPSDNLRIHQNEMKLGLKLKKYNSKSEVTSAANQWLFKNSISNYLRNLTSSLRRSILKRVKSG